MWKTRHMYVFKNSYISEWNDDDDTEEDAFCARFDVFGKTELHLRCLAVIQYALAPMWENAVWSWGWGSAVMYTLWEKWHKRANVRNGECASVSLTQFCTTPRMASRACMKCSHFYPGLCVCAFVYFPSKCRSVYLHCAHPLNVLSPNTPLI